MRNIILLFFTFARLTAISQTYSEQNFKEANIPEAGSGEWYQLNQAVNFEIHIALVNGKPVFCKNIYNTVQEYALADGKLLAVNYGEFGGGLYFLPGKKQAQVYLDGKKASVQNNPWGGGLMVPESNPVNKKIANAFLLKNGVIDFIFPYKNSLFLAEGLSHLGLVYGALFRLDVNGSSFHISKALDIEDAPKACAIYQDIIFLVTSSGLYTIDSSMKKTKIFEKTFWGGLYPNSIVVIDLKHIYIGMRGGYVLADTDNKSIRLFRYWK